MAPPNIAPNTRSRMRHHQKRRFRRVVIGLFLLGLLVLFWNWITLPSGPLWPDRRPIGVLFLASNFHSSPTNPRGWFQDPRADYIGPGGVERFHESLIAYATRSIANLKRLNAQGVIVWDLEGEQFPHKTTYIGDPRLLGRLAPEMAAVVDEFFKLFKDAGFKVGLTVRPQRLVFDAFGLPHQTEVMNIQSVLAEKIDFARSRWGATLFYVDSNWGVRRPDEAFQWRRLAEQRPDILLIPEHSWLPYSAFAAPYVPLRAGRSPLAASLERRFFPKSFRVLDVGETDRAGVTATAAWRTGDILMCRAWYWNPECDLVERLIRPERSLDPAR